MTVVFRSHSRLRIALILAVWSTAATCAMAQAQPPEPLKSPPEGKNAPTPKELPGIRLPDGTFLWFGPGNGDERVSLSPQEFQKLQEQIDQLKKQLAARRGNRSERLRDPRPGREARRTARRSPETDTLIPHHPAQNARFAGWEEGVPGFRVARWRQAADPRDGGRRFRRGHRNAR